MALAAAVASEYAVITHTERVVSAAPLETKGLARRQVGAVGRRLRSVFFEHMCATNKNAPTYWDTHVPTALPTMPSFGGPSTRYRFRVQFNVDVSDATSERRSRVARAEARRRADERDERRRNRGGSYGEVRVRGDHELVRGIHEPQYVLPERRENERHERAAQRREAQRVRDVL
jgi:hypothetical protein